MSTSLVKRDARGFWEKGTASPNPGGMPPQTTARLWCHLLREPVGVMADGTPCLKEDGSPYTRAEALFHKAFERAMDEERKDSVLYLKLLVERAEGPARPHTEDEIGLPALLRDAHERWLKKREAGMPATEGA